ncbi:MAG: UDP-glucuronic acid decarboxylase family protein [Weeksellaceae bacterium]
MKILITGGSGFIGSHLARTFIQKGAEVYIIDNLVTGNKNNIADLDTANLHFFEADITTFDFSVIPAVDIIFHLASPASPIQYKIHSVETLLTNSLGTYKVLEYMRATESKRLVLASTSEIYGDPLVHPQTEDYFGNVNTVGPRACYDEAKRFAEAMVTTYMRKYNLDIRIARIFNTYGPNMEINDGRVVSNFITQAISGKPITIYGNGDQTRSFCYVSDMIRGLSLLAETDGIAGQIINIGNPEEKTMKELATIVKAMVTTSSEIVYHPIDQDDPRKRKPDITKAQTLLGWKPEVKLEDGLQKTIEYFREALRK